MADRHVNTGQMAASRSLPQSHSSELSEQSTPPSHHRSRGTHSWLTHSSSSAWQNAGRGTKKEEEGNVCGKKANSVHVDRWLFRGPTIKLLSESHINLFRIF